MTNIQAQPDRLMLLQWLLNTKKEWVWEQLAELKEHEIDENIEAKYFPPMTFDDYSKRIDEARLQVKLGQVTSLQDFEKEVEGWQ
jgi:hypothetical protein